MHSSRLLLLPAFALGVSLAACRSSTGSERAGPAVLLTEDFNQEHGGSFALNYTDFTRWTVTSGSVDLVGTYPYDDFLPRTQGLYVDLDGTMQAAGTLETRETFALPRGTYELRFKLAGTPRDNQPPNTVVVSLGTRYQESFTLPSFTPLQTYVRTITVTGDTSGKLRFQHQGGDDYGIFLDDVELRRL
jgi:hypothetical protein